MRNSGVTLKILIFGRKNGTEYTVCIFSYFFNEHLPDGVEITPNMLDLNYFHLKDGCPPRQQTLSMFSSCCPFDGRGTCPFSSSCACAADTEC
jgi:hypothetical protein